MRQWIEIKKKIVNKNSFKKTIIIDSTYLIKIPIMMNVP